MIWNTVDFWFLRWLNACVSARQHAKRSARLNNTCRRHLRVTERRRRRRRRRHTRLHVHIVRRCGHNTDTRSTRRREPLGLTQLDEVCGGAAGRIDDERRRRFVHKTVAVLVVRCQLQAAPIDDDVVGGVLYVCEHVVQRHEPVVGQQLMIWFRKTLLKEREERKL